MALQPSPGAWRSPELALRVVEGRQDLRAPAPGQGCAASSPTLGGRSCAGFWSRCHWFYWFFWNCQINNLLKNIIVKCCIWLYFINSMFTFIEGHLELFILCLVFFLTITLLISPNLKTKNNNIIFNSEFCVSLCPVNFCPNIMSVTYYIHEHNFEMVVIMSKLIYILNVCCCYILATLKLPIHYCSIKLRNWSTAALHILAYIIHTHYTSLTIHFLYFCTCLNNYNLCDIVSAFFTPPLLFYFCFVMCRLITAWYKVDINAYLYNLYVIVVAAHCLCLISRSHLSFFTSQMFYFP